MRITKYIALCGITSRRKTKEIIETGRVKINGKLVFDLNRRIDPVKDRVFIDNSLIAPLKKRYIILNKPAGYLCSKADNTNRKTVYDIVRDNTLNIAGRLDINSEGLVFMSNDGNLLNLLMHPSNMVIRTYRAKVKGLIDRSFLYGLEGKHHTADDTYYVDKIGNISYTGSNTWFDISIHEGKKREIRNLMKFYNLYLVRLIRVQLGPFTIDRIQKGSYVEISQEKIDEIKRAINWKTE